MDAVLENGLEFAGHVVNKHWDHGYDRVRKYVNGKKVEDDYRPVRVPRLKGRPASPSLSSSNSQTGVRSTSQSRNSNHKPSRRRSPDRGGTAVLVGDPVARPAASELSGARRKQLKTLPAPPQGDDQPEFSRDRETVIAREIEQSDRVLRLYEAEANDPKRNPESVLDEKDLWTLEKSTPASRRDSAMAYNDSHQQNSQYQGEDRARSAQPARSRVYDDDEESDYDERSGRRYGGGSGRGYDDREYRDRDRDYRDYDRVVEETERYRGPRAERPWGGDRRDSYRTDPYGAGAVARRSDPQLDRSYVSRPKSRGRDDRDRSYSRSRSRSRTRSRSREGGIRGAVDNAFDTSTRGLGVGLAGAVIGGLAGREFGKQHRQRDIIIGALVGGLGANAAANKYQDWRVNKREQEDRLEARHDDRRSRSNVR